MLEVINETAVIVFWSAPDSPNGVIREYQIIYTGYKPDLEVIPSHCFNVIIKSLIFPQQANEEKILDGPNIVNIPAKLDRNPGYSIVINDLVLGLAYEIKVG